jgi:hypothetical protein
MQVHETTSSCKPPAVNSEKKPSSTWSSGVKGIFNISGFKVLFKIPTFNFGIKATYKNVSQRIKNYFYPDEDSNRSEFSKEQTKMAERVKTSDFQEITSSTDWKPYDVKPFN